MKKARLALDQLEKELALIPQLELSKILGGNGSGSSGYVPGSSGYNPGGSGYNPGYGGSGYSGYSTGGSGSQGLSPDAGIDEVMAYLFAQGVPMSTSSGNYYFMGGSGAFMLNEVTITGTNSSGSTGNEWYNSYFSGFSSGSTLDIYVSVLAANGYTFTSDGAGGYTYTSPPAQDEDQHPFLTVNGKIARTKTGRKASPTQAYSYELTFNNGETIYWDEVKIKTADGKDIIAYETKEVWKDGKIQIIEDRHKSNCTGLAFANGELWIFDSDLPTNETTGFENLLGDTSKYETTTNESEADYVIIRDTSGGETHIRHSGIRNADGSYTHKSNHQGQTNSNSLNEFKVGHYEFHPEVSGITSNITFYKRI